MRNIGARIEDGNDHVLGSRMNIPGLRHVDIRIHYSGDVIDRLALVVKMPLTPKIGGIELVIGYGLVEARGQIKVGLREQHFAETRQPPYRRHHVGIFVQLGVQDILRLKQVQRLEMKLGRHLT